MPRPIDERRLAFFGAFCFFLSTLEFLVPKPLPFLRIGLANLPILLCLAPAEKDHEAFSARFILALASLKIAGQALLGGTLFSYVFLFSAAGSAASAAVMLASRRLFGKRLSLAGIGVLGSLGSNLTQIIFARELLLGEGVWLVAPFFLLLGTPSGFLLGVFAEALRENSAWLASPENAADEKSVDSLASGQAGDPAAFFYALCGLVSVFPFVFTEALPAKLVLAAFYMALTAACGKRVRLLPNLVLVVTVTAVHALAPFGKVLFTLWGRPVTEGAVHAGLFRSAALVGLVYLSRLAVRPSLRFPGRAGRVLSAALNDFAAITESGLKIERKNFWAGLDRLLAAVYAPRGFRRPAAAPKPFGPREAAAGLVMAFVTWAAYAYWHIF